MKDNHRIVIIIVLSILTAVGVFFSIFTYALYNSLGAKDSLLPYFIISIVATVIFITCDILILFTFKKRKKSIYIFLTSMGLSIGMVLTIVPLISLSKVVNDPPAWVLLILGILFLLVGSISLIMLIRNKKEE